MIRALRYIGIVLLILMLIAIRGFEEVLFYDPYLEFFKNDYLYRDNPRREIVKLLLNTALRYVLNSAASLGIIYLLFNDKSIVKFAVLVFAASFVLFIVPYLYFVVNPKQDDYYLFFNVRRFLIQPVILIFLLPAFYYYKLKR